MSQRRIRERGGGPNKGEGSSERGSLFERKLPREGGFVKETAHKRRSIIREGVH